MAWSSRQIYRTKPPRVLSIVPFEQARWVNRDNNIVTAFVFSDVYIAIVQGF
ncbi:hypothetical protein C4K01_0279 [Pseudomonas synxantha]|nr:hypothetical protein C4K01_0279 [Pseudomonas synxantha]